MKKIFNYISQINHKIFGSSKKSLNFNNKFYINFLNTTIADNNISSIIDIGCGNWEIYENINMENIKYLGIDCNENIIEKNLSRYGNKNIKFMKKNVLEYDELPKVDLFILKDVIQTMSNDDIKKIIEKIKNAKPKLVIISSTILPYSIKYDFSNKNNLYRPINLEYEPFNYKFYNKYTYYDKLYLIKYIIILSCILFLAIKKKYKLYIFVLFVLILVGIFFPKNIIYLIKN